MTIQNSEFASCTAKDTHLRDGKGGALAVCGGVQLNSTNQDAVVVTACHIHGCQASGNGGGLYVTIRGSLTVEDTSIVDCEALDLAQSPVTEGMGGGIHVSAGGLLQISGSTDVNQNTAAVSGGGLSVKSGIASLDNEGFIAGNVASGSSIAGYGNGGGIFVTTSLYDDDPPLGAGWGAATLYAAHGSLTCSSDSLTIANNVASRWGGGVYVGLSPPWYGPNRSDTALVQLRMATIQDNLAHSPANASSLLPSQVAAEKVGALILPAQLDFTATSISGNSTNDIGIYTLKSDTPVVTGISWGALATQTLAQP